MYQFIYYICVKMTLLKLKIGIYWCLYLFLAIAATACNSSKIATQSIESKVPPQVIPTIANSPPVVQQNEGEVYQQALARADAAKAIGQSALSKDDWFLVVNNLEDSVHMLKSIAPNSSEYILAAKVLPKYERELATAKQKAVGFKSKFTPKVVSSPPQIATSPQTDTFSIPIAQKLGGIPVIEVSFNSQKVLMLLDTGASRTLITNSIAQKLQLQTTGLATAKTANGTATFSTAKIDKIKFGDGETNDVMVAVGQNDLPYGLLGHDVYDGYDITIKENLIEFRKR
jgi:clan AA aspartic protease (TIGR02281 family)